MPSATGISAKGIAVASAAKRGGRAIDSFMSANGIGFLLTKLEVDR